MDHCIMSYGDIVSNMDRHDTAYMDGTVFQNIRLLPDHNRRLVSTDHCKIKHTAVPPNRHIPYEYRSLIGMGAVILDGTKIGNDCIIGAGSLVTKNTVIPDCSLEMGSPAKIKRNLTWEEK